MKTIRFLTLTALLGLIACSKGDTGATGATGPAGANGAANMNVTDVTVTPGSWSTLSAGYYGCAITVSALTDFTMDEVTVAASSTNTVFFGLPVSNFLTNGDALDYTYDNGAVQMIYQGPAAPTVSLAVKITVIPPQ